MLWYNPCVILLCALAAVSLPYSRKGLLAALWYNVAMTTLPLLAMITYNRCEYTKRAVAHLLDTMLGRAELYIVDNGSTDGTAEFLAQLPIGFPEVHLVLHPTNLGTARAINSAWKNRTRGQVCAYMPNDVEIADADWLQHAQDAFRAYPDVGTINLKWARVVYSLNNPNPALRTTLAGQVQGADGVVHALEECLNPFGAALVANPALIDRIGGFNQPDLYGWDDILYLVRSKVAGYRNVFLADCGVNHFDDGSVQGNTQEYLEFKKRQAYAGQQKMLNFIKYYVRGGDLLIPLGG